MHGYYQIEEVAIYVNNWTGMWRGHLSCLVEIESLIHSIYGTPKNESRMGPHIYFLSIGRAPHKYGLSQIILPCKI